METLNLRQLASNFTFLAGGEIVSKICTFAAFTFVARVLGPSSFGQLEFTIALMVLFSLLVDFGTSPYGARELAKHKNRAREIISNVVSFRLLSAVAGYLLLSAFAFLVFDKDTRMRSLILVYGLTLLGIPGFLQWIFQGFDKMTWVACGSVFRQLIFVTGVFLCIRSSEHIMNVAIIECVAVGVFVLYCLVLYRSQIGRLGLRINLYSLKSHFSQTLTIGLSQLIWAATWYFATILLALAVGGKVVGWFSAAHRPVMTLHTFIWLYFFNLFPSMSRSAQQGEKTLKDFVNASLRITSWAAIFVGIAGTLLAEPLILLVFGPQYSESASIFSILIWMLPVALLSGHYRYALIASGNQRYEFISQIGAAFTALSLGFILVSIYSAKGGAIALLIATAINFALAYFFTLQRICHIPFVRHILRPLLAGGIMVVVFHLLRPINLWFAGAVAIILYVTTLAGFQRKVKRLII